MSFTANENIDCIHKTERPQGRSCHLLQHDMNGNNELTMDFIRSLMEPSYTLVWVDHDDNLDNNLDVIEKCLDERKPDTLYDRIDGWFSHARWHGIDDTIRHMREECADKGVDKWTVMEFMEEHRDEIEEIIYERDDSDILGALLKNTDDIPVRVEMLSNYDCINSHWLEAQGGYIYPGSYFGDMVNALNLNLAKVKRVLAEKGIPVHGRCPDKSSRNGKELVSYEDFRQELVNSCCGANLLTYIGKVNVTDLYESGFDIAKVTIPKGNCCGIFSSMFGGGSLLEMKLRQDVTIELKTENCHGYRLMIDAPHKKYDYSIGQVYGVCDSFFGDTVRLIPAQVR